jgi:hypothetical protein
MHASPHDLSISPFIPRFKNRLKVSFKVQTQESPSYPIGLKMEEHKIQKNKKELRIWKLSLHTCYLVVDASWRIDSCFATFLHSFWGAGPRTLVTLRVQTHETS